MNTATVNSAVPVVTTEWHVGLRNGSRGRGSTICIVATKPEADAVAADTAKVASKKK